MLPGSGEVLGQQWGDPGLAARQPPTSPSHHPRLVAGQEEQERDQQACGEAERRRGNLQG